jgi:hypothetical protein
MRQSIRIAASLQLLCAAAAALALTGVQAPARPPGPWRALFDGTTMDAWRGYKSDAMPAGWRIDGDAMIKDAPTGDIVTRETFGNFELELDWKIGRAGNSGIFYRGHEDFANVYDTAPEYQLLDDIDAEDNKTRSHCAGALYDIIAAPVGHLRPVGEWNTARIVANGPHVEHWLNGAKLLEYDLGTDAWKARFGASKFADVRATPSFANFAAYRSGYIGIQANHPGSLALRRIRIRELR